MSPTRKKKSSAAPIQAPIKWAPRVKQSHIRKLYESDAQGMLDGELLDEVGQALRERCLSFIDAVEALHGRAKCPSCGQIILHHKQPDAVLHCAGCGWETTWLVYHKSFQHKQLSGAEPVLALFRAFIDKFPKARSSQEKMLLVDQLIHGFHEALTGHPTRTTGVNLIEGSYHEVVDFLDQLTYGNHSTPGLSEKHDAWRNTIDVVAKAWQDARLRRRAK